MAHFAKISENNIVLNVLTLNDKDMSDENGNLSELLGQQYLQKHNNWPAHLWIQTSYNTINNEHKLNGTPFRGNYAGIGYIWDSVNNIFITSKPFNSWVLNLNKARWESPIGEEPQLTEEERSQLKKYSWNEEILNWVLI
jgi:hypothetical protein